MSIGNFWKPNIPLFEKGSPHTPKLTLESRLKTYGIIHEIAEYPSGFLVEIFVNQTKNAVGFCVHKEEAIAQALLEYCSILMS